MKLFQVMVLSIFLWLGLGLSSAHALTANIQGEALKAKKIEGVAGACVIIAGNYSGFRIVGSEAGKAPKICIDKTRKNVNALKFINVTFVATEVSDKVRTVNFAHGFLNGPQGLVYSRVKLEGFFATADGVGVPTDNQVWFSGAFDQSGHSEAIGEELAHKVDKDLDSALLNDETQSQFVLSGPRALKGELKFTLLNRGDKLVLESDTAVIIDSIKRRQ